MKLKKFLIGSAKLKPITLLLLLCLSCASHSTKQKVDIQITIEELQTSNKWKVTYKLDSPALALVFQRQTNQFRQKSWNILNDKDLQITKVNGQEVIISKSNKAFKEVILTHDTYDASLEKDYEFFINFSNTETLIYTGHYLVTPLNRNLTEHIFKFKANSTDKKIIVAGEVFQESTTWVDKEDSGTYVYWGSSEPLKKDRFTIVVAEDTPEWIKKSTYKNLPKLFNYYEKKLELDLNFKPVVYLNHSDKSSKRMRNSGGTLPGLIQLSISGSPWEQKTELTQEWLLWFLAHEAAHLWNTQLVQRSSGGKHAWLHEGSANAFAYKALLHFKLISQQDYLETINKEKSKCIQALKGGHALVKSNKRRKFKSYYSCGHIIALLTEKTTGKDIFSFWRTLLKEQKNKDNQYDDTEYFELWRRLSKNQQVITQVEELVYKSSQNLKALFK